MGSLLGWWHRADHYDTLIKTADDAMYTAKRAGGNQIRHAHVDMSEL